MYVVKFCALFYLFNYFFYLSFFVLNQVSVIQDGDFQINVLVEGGRITSFDFSMNGKRLYRPFESEENEDA